MRIVSVVLVFSIFILTSCSNTPQKTVSYPLQGYVSGIAVDGSDVFFSGNVGIGFEQASFWDSVVRTKLTTQAFANGIIRYSGSTYVYGTMSILGNYYPVYWNSGSNHVVNSDYGSFLGGTISGSVMLLAGYYLSGTTPMPAFWSNDTKITLSSTTQGQANTVIQSGSVQLAVGFMYQGSVRVAELWTNGPTLITLQSVNVGSHSEAADVAYDAGNQVWYVTGYGRNAANIPIPCYWTNINAPVLLPYGVNGGSSFAIDFTTGPIVSIAGYTNDSSGLSHPVYWTNGVLVGLEDGGAGGLANSITNTGSEVFVAGYVYTNGNIQIPCWWSNSNCFTLPVE